MIRGYAARWNALVRPGNRAEPCIVLPNAIQLRGCQATLRVFHLDEPYAFAARESLRLFADDYGLGFEADCLLPGGHHLENSIRSGQWTRASVGYGALRNSRMEERDGELVEVISRTWIDEISIVDRAGSPGTAVWLSDMRPEQMAPHAAKLEARWRAGRDRARSAAAGIAPTGASPRRASVPAGVRAFMNGPLFPDHLKKVFA